MNKRLPQRAVFCFLTGECDKERGDRQKGDKENVMLQIAKPDRFQALNNAECPAGK